MSNTLSFHNLSMVLSASRPHPLPLRFLLRIFINLAYLCYFPSVFYFSTGRQGWQTGGSIPFLLPPSPQEQRRGASSFFWLAERWKVTRRGSAAETVVLWRGKGEEGCFWWGCERWSRKCAPFSWCGLKKSGGSLVLLTMRAPAVWKRVSEFFLCMEYKQINKNLEQSGLVGGHSVRAGFAHKNARHQCREMRQSCFVC